MGPEFVKILRWYFQFFQVNHRNRMSLTKPKLLTNQLIHVSSPSTWRRRLFVFLFFIFSTVFVSFVTISLNFKLLGIIFVAVIVAYFSYFVAYSLLVWDVYCDSERIVLVRRQRIEQYSYDSLLLFGKIDTSSLQTHVIVFYDPDAINHLKIRYFWASELCFLFASSSLHSYLRTRSIENRVKLEGQLKNEFCNTWLALEKMRRKIDG